MKRDEPRKWRVKGPDGRYTFAIILPGWKPEYSTRQEKRRDLSIWYKLREYGGSAEWIEKLDKIISGLEAVVSLPVEPEQAAEKHRADREPMICYQGGKRLEGEEGEIVFTWLKSVFYKDYKLAYTSPPFTKGDRFKPEKVREESCLVEVTADVTPTRWNDSTEMKDITFYWDELKGEWNSLHDKDSNKPPANNGEMFNDARFMRWLRKWCKGFLKRYSVGGKGGTLPEVYKLYGTVEFKEEKAIVKSFKCEDVESLAMEFLWRYSDIVKINGKYCLTYYRRRLEEYFIKQLIERGAKKNKQMQQGAAFQEDVTELYSWDGTECGTATPAQYGSASGGESDENEIIADAWEKGIG